MSHKYKFQSLALVSLSVLGLISCSRESKSGGSSVANSDSSKDSFTSVDVTFGESEGFNLVENAMVSFKATLGGGENCWGARSEAYDSAAASPALIVSRVANGCTIKFNEVKIKDGPTASDVITFTSADGLQLSKNVNAQNALYVSGDNKLDLTSPSILVEDSTKKISIQLKGVLSIVKSVATDVTDWEVPIQSVEGEILPPPAVKFVANELGHSNGMVYFSLACITNASVEKFCKSEVVSQTAGAAADTQSLDAMKAWIKYHSAADIAAFRTDTIAASEPTSGLEDIVIEAATPFKGKGTILLPTPPSPLGDNKPVLFIRHLEGTKKSYRAFVLKQL